MTRRRLHRSTLSSFPHRPLVMLDRIAAGAPRSQPPQGFRLPRRSLALRLVGVVADSVPKKAFLNQDRGPQAVTGSFSTG
jgi:hypothetical protein